MRKFRIFQFFFTHMTVHDFLNLQKSTTVILSFLRRERDFANVSDRSSLTA
jgi:hypothetical protein